MDICCSPVSQAIIENNVEQFKELLNKRKRIDIQDNMGYTSLHIAATKAGEIDPIIFELLLNHPDTEINSRSHEGQTSLYLACRTNSPAFNIIEMLLNHGANPNIADTEDVSPLHLACRIGSFELAELLLRFNANINCQDFNSYTPLHYAIEFKFKILTLFLLSENADANITELNGLNPLMFALDHKWEFAYFLVRYTENVNQKTIDNVSTVELALRKRDFRVLKLLLQSDGIDLTVFDNMDIDTLMTLFHCEFEIFRLAWPNIRLRIFENDYFFHVIFRRSVNTNDFRYLQIYLNDPGLNLQLHNKEGIFQSLFAHISEFSNTHFEMNQEIYFDLLTYLLNKKIVITTNDLKSFINFFKTCPYKIELWSILLGRIIPNVSENLLLFALEKDLRIATILLRYCIHLDPESLFHSIGVRLPSLQNRNCILKYLLRFFTPNIYFNQLVEKSHDAYDEEVKKLLETKVKSLGEIARDEIRNCIRNNCKESSAFYLKVQQLQIPRVMQRYITCEETIKKL